MPSRRSLSFFFLNEIRLVALAGHARALDDADRLDAQRLRACPRISARLARISIVGNHSRPVIYKRGFRVVEMAQTRLRQRHYPTIAGPAVTNDLNLLPLSSAQRTWPDLLLAR